MEEYMKYIGGIYEIHSINGMMVFVSQHYTDSELDKSLDSLVRVTHSTAVTLQQ